MPVRPLDTLLAIKVLSLVDGLNTNDRRVAAVLLEHYNRLTTRCDPGLERIAALIGVSTRTVIRSNKRLERAGLFRKVRHGGHGNCNSYEPAWTRFAQHEASWRKKMKGAEARVASVSPAAWQSGHVRGDGAVTQTFRTNLPQRTCSKRQPEEAKIVGHLTQRAAPRIRNQSADAARSQAERRWSNDLHNKYGMMPVTYGQIIDAIDRAMQAAATECELKSRGAGLNYLLKQLKIA